MGFRISKKKEKKEKNGLRAIYIRILVGRHFSSRSLTLNAKATNQMNDK